MAFSSSQGGNVCLHPPKVTSTSSFVMNVFTCCICLHGLPSSIDIFGTSFLRVKSRCRLLRVLEKEGSGEGKPTRA